MSFGFRSYNRKGFNLNREIPSIRDRLEICIPDLHVHFMLIVDAKAKKDSVKDKKNRNVPEIRHGLNN